MSVQRRNVVHELAAGEVIELTVPKVAVDTGKITLTLEHKSGRHARLRITAGDDVVINRPSAGHKRAS